MDHSSLIELASSVVSLAALVLGTWSYITRNKSNVETDTSKFIRDQVYTKADAEKDRARDLKMYEDRLREKDAAHAVEIRDINRDHEDRIRQITSTHNLEVNNLTNRISLQDDKIKAQGARITTLEEENARLMSAKAV